MILYTWDAMSPLMVKGMGREHLIPPRPHVTRTAQECIFYYVISGRLELNDNGKPLTLLPGDAYIFHKGDFHKPTAVTDCSYYWVHFATDFEEWLPDETDLQSVLAGQQTAFHTVNPYDESGYHTKTVYLPKQLHIESSATGRRMVRLLDEAIQAQRDRCFFFKQLISAYITEILLELSGCFAAGVLSRCKGSGTEVASLVNDYIDLRFGEKITGETIGKALGYSFDYLNRRYKEETGQTVFERLTAVRIRNAKMMLRAGVSGIADTARKCGFCDVYYFTRVFKNATGTTPGKWLRGNARK